MSQITAIALGSVLLGLLIGYFYSSRKSAARFQELMREHVIRTHAFSQSLFDSLQRQHPSLNDKDAFLVARALRTFFLAHLKQPGVTVAMPSKAADALWHQFILDTHAYTQFCENAFGSYFHHIPATDALTMSSNSESLLRTWRMACMEENINPRRALRLPLLFALDQKLGFPNGNVYSLEQMTKDARRNDGGSGISTSVYDGDGGDGGGGGCGGGD
jgi:hypothetical protein